MPRQTRDRARSDSPNLKDAADRGSIGSRSEPRRADSTKPEVQNGMLGVKVSRQYDNAFPGITNTESIKVGFDNLFERNRISGSVDPQRKKASADIGFGTKGADFKIGIGIDFSNGLIPNIAIDFGATVAGIGARIGGDTRGGGKVGISVGIGSVDIATDEQGNQTATFCIGIPGFEICNEYARPKKPLQPLPFAPRPVIPKPAPVAKPVKPKKPKLPTATKPRLKPKPKPKKPKPPTRPIVPRTPKPIKPKRPPVPPKPKPITPPKPPATAKPIPPKRPTPHPKLPSVPRPPRPKPVAPPTPTPTPTQKTWKECYPTNNEDGYTLLIIDKTKSVVGREQWEQTATGWNNIYGYETTDTWVWDANRQTGTLTRVERRWASFQSGGSGVGGFEPYDVTNTTISRVSNVWGSTSGYARSDTFQGRYSLPTRPTGMPPLINGFRIWGWQGLEYEIRNAPPGCPKTDSAPPTPTPTPVRLPPPVRLPNKPPEINPMDCCKEIKEIHKYLGIKKIKKNKFKIAKAFMVPGGTGNEECEDYYQLQQALIRMLANGLIINPISKPLGSEWKSVNATAWAGQVYEMTAEAMSNGNSSQKFEISMMMQITQLLSILSEQTRKIEFLSEVLGVEPNLDTEELAACFTIYEGHKGFEKKEPKKIDIDKAKSDDEVEVILGKMLQPSKIPITKWVFKPESKSIIEILLDQ